MVKKKRIPQKVKRSPKVTVPLVTTPAETDPDAFTIEKVPYLQGVLMGRPCATLMSNRGPVFYYVNQEVKI